MKKIDIIIYQQIFFLIHINIYVFKIGLIEYNSISYLNYFININIIIRKLEIYKVYSIIIYNINY